MLLEQIPLVLVKLFFALSPHATTFVVSKSLTVELIKLFLFEEINIFIARYLICKRKVLL